MVSGPHSDGIFHPPASPRLRVAAELATLAILTLVFLVYAPRDNLLYVAMALLFLGFIGLGAKETREKIWGQPAQPRAARMRRSTATMAIFTIPLVLSGLAWSGWQGYRIPYVHLALALCFYFMWALLQQTIFQFYLLGRLRTLMPKASPWLLSSVNGLAYGSVHLPDLPLALLTGIAGIFWSHAYQRDRLLLPVAASHAILGTVYYYLVIGRDLAGEMAARLTGAA